MDRAIEPSEEMGPSAREDLVHDSIAGLVTRPARQHVIRGQELANGDPTPGRSDTEVAEHLEKGKYGPILPKTPACYGFTVIANVKPGRAEAIRAYGQKLADALEVDPFVLPPLKLHYLRWVLFNDDTRFMYQGIFDTDFDKYTEDAVALFRKTGIDTAFENLEGFPDDWKTNTGAFVEFVRAHQCNSFLEYGEYPYVSSDEIKKALKIKAALTEMLDQLQ